MYPLDEYLSSLSLMCSHYNSWNTLSSFPSSLFLILSLPWSSLPLLCLALSFGQSGVSMLFLSLLPQYPRWEVFQSFSAKFTWFLNLGFLLFVLVLIYVKRVSQVFLKMYFLCMFSDCWFRLWILFSKGGKFVAFLCLIY